MRSQVPISTMTDLNRLELNLIIANYLKIERDDWKLNNVVSGFWRLYVQSSPGAFVVVGHHATLLKPGRIYLIPAGVKFSAGTEIDMDQFYIHFEILGLYGIVMREWFSDVVVLPESFPLSNWLNQIIERHAHGLPADMVAEAQMRAVIYSVLVQYLLTVPRERIEDSLKFALTLEPVMPAVRYIESHIAEAMTNAVLASQCAMSEGHFIRKFQACIGQSPVQYIQSRRVQQAAYELLHTDRSLAVIAAEAGFGSNPYFNRIFARITGLSPAKFRKTRRQTST